MILEKLKPTWVFTGHDHVGCITDHVLIQSEETSNSLESFPVLFSFKQGNSELSEMDGVIVKTVEVTQKSIMGDFAGGVGLFEFTIENQEDDASSTSKFSYTYQECPYLHHLTIRAVIIVDVLWLLITVNGVAVGGCIFFILWITSKKEKED